MKMVTIMTVVVRSLSISFPWRHPAREPLEKAFDMHYWFSRCHALLTWLDVRYSVNWNERDFFGG